MNRKTSMEDICAWDRSHNWHAFTQMAEYEPLLFERGEGVWLFDQTGRPLLDGVSSMWCNVHGHRHPAIDQAIREQLDRVAHVTSLGAGNSTSVKLARELVERSPASLQSVFFSSDGSSAVEVALKQAFQYWRQIDQPQPQRDLFVAVGNAYHGDTLGSVSVGGVSRFHAMFDPLLFDVVRGPCPDTYRLPDGVSPDEATAYYLKQYEQLFDRFSDRIAGLVLEPLVQGAAGMVIHPPGLLRALRELTKRHGTFLIADEIAVGMGRTGTLWACEQEEVEPDFLCVGKGLSGGYLPVAATLTTREVWNAFLGEYAESRSFFHGHTYGGNPLGAAAALATLQVFDEENTLTNVGTQGDYLCRLLQEKVGEHPNVGDIRARGLVAAVELVQDQELKSGFPWADRMGHQVCEAAMQKGVWLRPLGNVIVIMPPLCVQAEHVEQIVEAVRFGIESTSWS